ncbi:Acetyltransferase GNAT family [Bacillus cereus]|nr:Acetyltransferase GNAT family [Bacillus cereus]
MQKLYFTKFEEIDFNLYFQLVSNKEVMAQITERTIPL